MRSLGYLLGAALPLSLTIDNPYQVVGGKPKFTVIGAPPGSTVYWSSYKDGVATGELNAGYSQVVESNGTAVLEGGEWKTEDAGIWIKEILVQTPDGANHTAMVQFRVGALAPATATPAPASGGGFLNEPVFTFGDYDITPLHLAIGAGALYFLTKKR